MTEAKFPDDFEPTLMDEINDHLPVWEANLRSMLPTLPEQFLLDIREMPASDNTECMEGGWDFGVGGSTPTPSRMTIEIERDTGLITTDLLKAVEVKYDHEGYHLARGYSFESTGLTLIDVAVEEGLATKFEIIRAEGNPRYGHYGDRETMLDTLKEVREADSQSYKDWHRWKFYDPETDRHWILYRVGAFIVDEALTRNPTLKIEDLAQRTVQEILELSVL